MGAIRFNYLYRDAGNYKERGAVVFSDSLELSLDEMSTLLQCAFSQGCLFIANQIRVPERFLFERGSATSDDHCYHEFESLEFTGEIPDDRFARSAADFVREVEREARRGWRPFDPHVIA